jgi:uncharacterized membrane protein YfcA
MTVRVSIRAIQLCIAENKERAEGYKSSEPNKGDYGVVSGDQQKEPLLADPDQIEGSIQQPVEEHPDHKELKELHAVEANTPWFQLLMISFCWLVIFIIALFKGGHGVQSIVGVTQCSPAFWVLFALPFPILLTIMVLFGIYLFASTVKKNKIGYKWHRGDIKWTACNLFFLPSFFGMAGFFASLLGIGSGMLKAPILVELGLEPVVAAATSTYMILFTASITVAQYTFLGRMPFDYGVWFAMVGFFAALLGQLVIGYIVKKYKMQSLIVFLLVAVMLLSIFLMGGLGIARVVWAVQSGEYLGFKTPC